MEKCKWANLIINILLFFIGCNIISGFITLIAIIFGSIDRKIIEVVVYIGVFLLLFIAVKKIKKVIRNIINKEIFIKDNIDGFKAVSYIIYVFGIATCFIYTDNRTIELLAIGKIFSIKIETVIFLAVGAVCSVIAFVFEEAMNIKNEAEELKEENKYTI